MNEEIATFYVGNDIKIHIEFTDDNNILTDLDDVPTCYILQDSTTIETLTMSKTSTGTYEVWWNSSGQSKGVYTVEVRGTKGGKDIIDKAYLELT